MLYFTRLFLLLPHRVVEFFKLLDIGGGKLPGRHMVGCGR